jgi:hypothetical protein
MIVKHITGYAEQPAAQALAGRVRAFQRIQKLDEYFARQVFSQARIVYPPTDKAINRVEIGLVDFANRFATLPAPG